MGVVRGSKAGSAIISFKGLKVPVTIRLTGNKYKGTLPCESGAVPSSLSEIHVHYYSFCTLGEGEGKHCRGEGLEALACVCFFFSGLPCLEHIKL